MPRLNHLHLRVHDVIESRAFYIKHFGFVEHTRHGEVVFLRDTSDGVDLALAPAEKVEKMPDWFHFGFRLASPDEVVELYQKLLKADHVSHTLETYDDFVFFRCKDPDGYEVEVYWE
ncbi:MAG: VOC family protein [bacterium]